MASASKQKITFLCTDCGNTSPKWMGQCPHCKAWDSLKEFAEPTGGAAKVARAMSWSGERAPVMGLAEVQGKDYLRVSTTLPELDRVLGGGLVPGSVTLIGGDPGIGKSTLLLQALAGLGASKKVLYVTGEESLEQIALRAERLGLSGAAMRLLAEVEMETILAAVSAERPDVVVADSIQTLYSTGVDSAAGSVSQVKECATLFTRMAKQIGTSVILVGHVTKDGSLAGPRVLEHLVDTVLYFEGDETGLYRMIRAIKNRFGAVNELGVFRMGELGLEEVSNPSELFLTHHDKPVPGTCVLAAIEGRRPLLVEVQALTEEAQASGARRFASGFELAKLQMLLAVLNRHAGIQAFDQNVYVKAVGGMRLTEPAADLPAILAANSAITGVPLPSGLVVFGEVGLAGEVRPVSNAEARLREAAKVGFTQAVVPYANLPDKPIAGLEVHGVKRIDQALSLLRDLRVTA
jgi:DNA repair protein RadA/Sms